MSVSYISKKELERGTDIRGADLRVGIFNLIKSDFPGFGKEAHISISELNKYRRRYLASLIAQEKRELECIDADVIYAIKNN